MPQDSSWTEDQLRRLAELWSDPTQTIASIARELGVGIDPARLRAKKLGLDGRTVADRHGGRNGRRASAEV